MTKRAPSTFRQADLTRALKAARGAGITVRAVELDPQSGKIKITAVEPSGEEATTDLDKWMATHAR
jgi:hypothetical protein